ncbi:hypothetical protein T01_6604 [Trichinella spiralis]|uniref:Uncharacterized protein n=1 Tax=Trichinella spiralis TaxID=6334 RepID=A0A0V0YVH3_TRISP|nr:hypothetical protein T01_6604 [Trichinella spiralis]
MLEPVANTNICLDALCHSKKSSPAIVVLNAYRFDRWLYIVDSTRLKSGKWPDADGTADAAETSSS